MRAGRRAAGWGWGFTLIELLVVVAVIALLAAFLMPAAARARRLALRAKCLSNLRQIGIALTTYVNDNGEFPTCTNLPSLGLNDLPTIADTLSDVGEEVFRCPADTGMWEDERTSYEWSVMLNGRSTVERPNGEVHALWDYLPFHGMEDEEGARNVLFLDGHTTGL